MTTVDLVQMVQSNRELLAYCAGDGRIDLSARQPVRLAIGPTRGKQYANAQVDDYHHDRIFRRRPPLRLTVQARFSHPVDKLTGTAGFGFWNDPLGMTGQMRLRMPQCLWFFFGGGPNYLPLVVGDPGRGWRAATVNAATVQAVCTLPIAPFLAALMRRCRLKPPIWRWLQRVLRQASTPLDAEMGAWHRYEVEWRADAVRFSADGHMVLQAAVELPGPLGFVAWIDNQYMVAAPEGWIRHGVVPAAEQWLELSEVLIES